MEDTRQFIRIRGARQHNLKSINLSLPRDRLIVITGLSGSGKSTLAFDTIYAEGQRRYVESLSAYARQFLEMVEKPDVETIEGLTPTIAIEQRTGSANPRSTVATTTEIYDYLRVLYARVGEPHCPVCDRKIETQSAEQIVDAVMALPEGTRFSLLAPLVRGRKGEHRDVLAAARRQGFVRLRVDGMIIDAREVDALPKTRRHDIEAVVDRLVMKTGIRSRLTDSVETALKAGEGLAIVSIEREGGGTEDRLFSELYACPEHGISLGELSPRVFSFNSPYGACPECDGLGTRMKVDPDLLVGDGSLSVEEGIIASVRKIGYAYAMWYGGRIRRFLRATGCDPTTPFEKLPSDVRKALLRGCTKKQEEEWGFSWSGILTELEERFHRTDNDVLKARIHGYMASLPCPSCGGARLRKEALAVRIAGKNISQVTAMTVGEAVEFFGRLELGGEKGRIAAPLLKEIRDRLTFLRDVGLALSLIHI
ncbi:MAG: excinuclease ABC subunit UvrA, partial [Planctomycetota bacterium]|nr:excinuclease ABC subunit UvrA [Planctomycetota bacterium]